MDSHNSWLFFAQLELFNLNEIMQWQKYFNMQYQCNPVNSAIYRELEIKLNNKAKQRSGRDIVIGFAEKEELAKTSSWCEVLHKRDGSA